MAVEIRLNHEKIKRGEDITILIKRGDQSDNEFSLTVHDESGDSIYAIGVSGDKNRDSIVIPSEDIINWEDGRYFIRIFGVKNTHSFQLVD